MKIALLASLAILSSCKTESVATNSAPMRIVSVTITGDVLLQALVDSSRILAVSALADDSGIHEAAGLFPTKPRIGPDLEQIVSLRPDLVLLGSFHDPAFVDGIRKSGLNVEILQSPNSLEKVRTYLIKVATRLGEPAKGDSLVRWMDSTLDAVKTKIAKCPDRPRVLYWSEGFTAGDSSTIGDLLEVVGVQNLAAQAGIQGSQTIAIEDVIRLQPDWILRSSWEAGGSMKPLPSALGALNAVKEGKMAVVSGKLLLSTSHRCALAADSLARKLRPDCH
ncbi:MAG: ABC transporter substrate-binding protein [Fibrobacterota bacterium]